MGLLVSVAVCFDEFMSKIVNQVELAEIHGVATVTVNNWQEDGMPVLRHGERGLSNEYDVPTTIEWRVARERRKTESQRDRLTRLQADELEQRIAVNNRELIPAGEIAPTWTARVLTAAAYMASRQSRLAGLLEATPGVEAKRNLLKQEDAGFLTRLGVHGERMQQTLDALFEKLSPSEAAAFMRAIAGTDPGADVCTPIAAEAHENL
jgi:hypothetical protein